VGWEKIYTVTGPIDEPQEGAELDWEKETLHGEELVAAYDDEWPACPRVLLREGTLEPASLGITLAASRTALAITDYTDNAAVPVPPIGRAYVRRREGPSYDEARIYVNPAYVGLTLRADYHYYPKAGGVRILLVAADRLFFATAEVGKWRAWDGTTTTERGVVKPGEDGPAFLTGGSGGQAWGLTKRGGILARWGCEWSGWLEINGVEMAGFAYLGVLAQAAGASVNLTPSGRLVFGSLETVRVVDLPREGVLKTEAELAAPATCAVELTYHGGRVRSGEGGWVYRFDNTLVTSRSHAQTLCDDLAGRLEVETVAIKVTATDRYYCPPGALVRLESVARKSIFYRVAAARRDFTNATVELSLRAVSHTPDGEVVV